MTAARLVVTPYTPAAQPDHGHGVHLRGLLRALVDRTPLVIVHPAAGTLDPYLERRALATATYPPARTDFHRLRDTWAMATGRMLRTATLDIEAIERLVRALVQEHDVDTVWAEGIELGDVAAAIPSPVSRLVVLHEAARFASGRVAHGVGDRVVQALDRSAARRQERRVTSSVDAVVVFTPRDAEAVAHSRAAPIHVVPLGTELPADRVDPDGVDGRVVFVGNFAHRPNVDAANRLVSHIAPLLRARHPDAEVRLVGSNPPPEVLALAGPGVTVTGHVDDVTVELDQAAVFVAPIDGGGGTRVKVLEALAAGKAIVASPTAVDGLAGGIEAALVVADTDDAFADAVGVLLQDGTRRRALADAARAWAERARSWDAVADAHLDIHRAVRRR